MEIVKEESQPKPRTLNDVAQEFNQECYKHGRALYQIEMKEAEIAILKGQAAAAMEKKRLLDKEGTELSQATRKEAPQNAEGHGASVAAPEPAATNE